MYLEFVTHLAVGIFIAMPFVMLCMYFSCLFWVLVYTGSWHSARAEGMIWFLVGAGHTRIQQWRWGRVVVWGWRDHLCSSFWQPWWTGKTLFVTIQWFFESATYTVQMEINYLQIFRWLKFFQNIECKVIRFEEI